ncbi:MAG: hypothetical protein H0T99_01650 [Geodermatophilaceae bacterium]|nr:hypothetical protein [Geodermatophilaceae bacterium]MDQ3424261.1 hypothetical protein [Actinomycetota bacterium]
MTRTGIATRCYYAHDPKTRPGCQLTATVQIGSIALCPACAELRSTLGKGQPTRPLPALADTDAPDALDWVSQADADLRAAQHTLAASVQRARQHQHTWTAIAHRLETTRQAAQQRFGGNTMT